MVPNLSEGFGRRLTIKIEHADSLTAKHRTTDRHLGNIHVVSPKDRADSSNNARHIPMPEHQQETIQVGIASTFMPNATAIAADARPISP